MVIPGSPRRDFFNPISSRVSRIIVFTISATTECGNEEIVTRRSFSFVSNEVPRFEMEGSSSSFRGSKMFSMVSLLA